MAEALKREEVTIPEVVACEKEFCENPATCAMSFEPRVESYLPDFVTGPKLSGTKSDENVDNGRWHVQLAEGDQGAVDFSRKEGFGYLDLKYVLQGNKAAGPITLKITTKKKGHIILCQPPGVWGRLPENCGTLEGTDDAIVRYGRVRALPPLKLDPCPSLLDV